VWDRHAAGRTGGGVDDAGRAGARSLGAAEGGGEEKGDGGAGWGSREWGQTRRSGEMVTTRMDSRNFCPLNRRYLMLETISNSTLLFTSRLSNFY
jgi:hypothetical protein